MSLDTAELVEEIIYLKQINAELLGALREIVRGDQPHGTYSGSQCVDIAQAAIAKAEGK